jgi:hypothetical protein
MNIEFRQGLAIPVGNTRHLSLVNGSINLLVRNGIKVVFAHGPANYLIEEKENVIGAWRGPFSTTSSYYFYWDISTETGALGYGYTQVTPSFGPTLPLSPVNDQHFFDTSDNYMKVWNGGAWIKKIRVFAGDMINGVVSGLGAGSQVNIIGSFTAEPIRLFKISAPVRREISFSDFEFLTQTGDSRQDVGQLANFRISGLKINGIAAQNIPKNRALTFNSNGEIIPATPSNIEAEAVGISAKNLLAGDEYTFVTKGFVTDRENFNFSEEPLTTLYVGADGELTTIIPTTGSIQKVGYIVSPTTIFIDINPQIIISALPVTPSPTATPTPSVSVSAAVTITPTATPSPTPSITSSVTPTLTPTPTPTITLTPTPTPSSTTTVVAVTTGFVSGGEIAPINASNAAAVQSFPFASAFTNTTIAGYLDAYYVRHGGASSTTDGFTSGGYIISATGGNTEKNTRFPFSSPFSTSVNVGSLSSVRDEVATASSSTEAFTTGGEPSPNRSIIESFPFANPFATAVDVGNVGRYGESGHAAHENDTDGFMSGGSYNFNFGVYLRRFPFSAAFATTTDVGSIDGGLEYHAGVSNPEDGFGYAVGGQARSSFPIGESAPIRNVSSRVDSLDISAFTVSINAVRSFPFSNPASSFVDVGNLDRERRERPAGMSDKSTTGFVAGGYGLSGSTDSIVSFPFASPFTSVNNIGNLSTQVNDALRFSAGHQG